MRKTETLDRNEFLQCCPDDLRESLVAELNAWDGGSTCECVTFTVDQLGRIDSESSPRPAA